MAQPIEINSRRGQRPDQWKARALGGEQQHVDSYMAYDPNRKAQLLKPAIPRPMEFDFAAHPNLDPTKLDVIKPPSTKQPSKKTMATNRIPLILLLANSQDPDTGKRYTQAKLGELFGLNESTINSHLRNNAFFGHFVPEVKKDMLPQNEDAFFKGLALGDFQIRRVRRASGEMLIVATRASDKMQEIFEKTLGTWGSVSPNVTQTEIYLDPDQFVFFENGPKIDARFLDAKSRFAPFLLGLLASRLSGKQNRICLPKHNGLLPLIHRKYSDFFGERLGHLSEEINAHKGNKRFCVRVDNPGQTLANLAQVSSVQALPFFRTLGEIR